MYIACSIVTAISLLVMIGNAALTSSIVSAESSLPPSPIPYYIVEELPAGTLIGSVPVDAKLDRRYDAREMSMLRYSLIGQKIADTGDTVELFHVDEDTGIVSTVIKIDRDELCRTRVTCLVRLDVVVRPGQFFDVVKIVVDILDVNDHVPYFDAEWSVSGITLNVSESVLPGSVFSLPNAVDGDSGQFAVQGYRISRRPSERLSSGADEPFQLVYEPRFGDLRLITTSKLDREGTDCYRLVVEAYDGGDPVKTGSLNVTVKVIDANDNVPAFERAVYEFTVVENQPPGSVVGKVKATDRDLGINAQLRYSLSPQSDHKDVFTVDPDNGEIYIRAALDYERNSRYHLTVMVCDGVSENQLETGRVQLALDTVVEDSITSASPGEAAVRGSSLTAYATVRIHVVDSNDHVPRVNVNTLRSPPDVALLPVNAGLDAFVAYVTVADPDTGSSGEVTCSLHEQHTAPSNFRLDRLSPTQFQIVTSSPMDAGERSGRRHLVTVICRDLGEDVSKWSRADVIVDVAPPNDNSPTFERDVYECDVTMRTGIAVNDVITTVKAVDLDSGVSGQVKYRIDEPYSQLLDVDPDTGVVTAKVTLDSEQLASMTFNVVTYDLGVPSRSSTAKVIIVVHDDTSLTFHKPSYSFVVFENQPAYTEVGQITAFHPMMSHIRYDLFPEAEFDVGVGTAFEINTTTGEIYSKVVLDRERMAHFRLRATARSVMHAGTAMARVTVHVADLNDNRPRVHWPPPSSDDTNRTTIRLSTCAPSGHVVAVISADDPDNADNSDLVYTIVSGNEDDLFEVVSPREGRIAVKRSLARTTETWRMFSLRVDVTDRGMPPLSTSAILNIVVDASLPFAPAQKKRYVVINSNRTIVLVLSSLSSAMLVLLVTVALLLRRFVADRKDGGQTGSGNGNLRRLTSSRLVRTAMARYRDMRRRRAARQRRRGHAASRDFARPPPDDELSSMSDREGSVVRRSQSRSPAQAWRFGTGDCSGSDGLLHGDDSASGVVVVSNSTSFPSASSTFMHV